MKMLSSPNHELQDFTDVFDINFLASELPEKFEHLKVTAAADKIGVTHSGIPCEARDTNVDGISYSPHTMTVTYELVSDKMRDCKVALLKNGDELQYDLKRDANGLWEARHNSTSGQQDLDYDPDLIAFMSSAMGTLSTQQARDDEVAYMHSTGNYNVPGYMQDIAAGEAPNSTVQHDYSARCIRINPQNDTPEDFNVKFIEIQQNMPNRPNTVLYRVNVDRPVVRDGEFVVECMQLQFTVGQNEPGTVYTKVSYDDGEGNTTDDKIEDGREFVDQMQSALDYLLETKRPTAVSVA